MQLLAIIRKSPFARLLLFYIAGILSASVFYLQDTLFSFALTGAAIFLATTSFFIICRHPGYNTDWLSGLIFGLLLYIAGYSNMNIHNWSGNIFAETAGIKGTFLIEISDPPEIKERTVRATARIKGYLVDGEWKYDRQRIMVYVQKDSSSITLMSGDRILVKSRLYGITPPKNPGEFDYRRYLAAKGIYNQIYVESGLWKATGNSGRRAMRILAFRMQDQLLHTYQKIGLSNTLYSILSALTLGYKNDLETHTKQAFSQAGVMHVMALSGFNVAVIALAMGYLLVFSDRSRAGRILKTILIILIIWLFAFVTGLSPSVIRAAVMISFVMTGKLIHRQINTYNMLFASAFLLLTISPALISDISFQLSFAAVLGIIIYQPVIYRLLAFKHAVADRIWQMFSVSCAAQLSTLPFTLYYFHQFPVYFWLTNLYVVPLVSVIICVAGVFLIVSSIDPLMQVVGKVLALLLAALYKAVAFTEILPFSLIENIHISGIQTVVLIAFILFLGLFSLQRKIIALWLALGLFIIFQFMNTLQALTLRNQRVFMAGDLKGFSAINLISGRDGMLLSDSTLFPDDPVLQYPFRNFWIRHGVANQIKCIKFAENVFFDFSGKRVVILKDNNLYKFHADNRLKADMVIVTGNMKPDLNTIVRLLDPELVILDASVQHYKAVKWIKECQQQGVKYWHVSQQGAYLLTIR